MAAQFPSLDHLAAQFSIISLQQKSLFERLKESVEKKPDYDHEQIARGVTTRQIWNVLLEALQETGYARYLKIVSILDLVKRSTVAEDETRRALAYRAYASVQSRDRTEIWAANRLARQYGFPAVGEGNLIEFPQAQKAV